MAARYRWDDFVLDLDSYRLERAGVALSLEPKAFNLLVLVIGRPGHVFTKQEIFDALWPATAVTDHALTRVVAQLRRVLGDEAREPRYLETVPTRGYRWIPPVHEVVDAPPTRSTPPAGALEGSPPSFSSRLAAAVGLCLLVIGSLVWLQRGTTSATNASAADVAGGDGGPRSPVQVTTHNGLDLQPALSPIDDSVAFVSDRSGGFEIYVRSTGSAAAEAPLTTDGGQNVQPAWSPDGRLVAYHSYRHGGIWVIPARGGQPRQVTPSGSNPAWAPDGRYIAFQSDEHLDVSPDGFTAQSGSTIWMVEPDGTHLQQLTRGGSPLGGHAAPSWARDGRFLAFSVFDGGNDNGVWILDLANRHVAQLERGSFSASVFDHDGSALYVTGSEALVVRIPFDPAKGCRRGPTQAIPVPGVSGIRGLTLSADGKRLGFAALGLNSQIWAQPVDREGSSAGAAFPLTSDTSRRNLFPKVSPDGARVAYTSSRRGELPNVWVMDLDGGKRVQLTSDDTPESKPEWFPDGRRIAYTSFRRERRGIWTVDLATRREELLADTTRPDVPAGTVRPSGVLTEMDLAPSMTQVAFTLMAPPEGRRVTYVTGIDRFTPRPVTDGRASTGYPFWSPDERLLAVQIKDGSSTHAGIVDVAAGTVTRITNDAGHTWPRSWSPDGRKIAAATMRNGAWSLRWFAADGKSQGIITPPEPPRVYVRYPDWSPRGDVVLFERGEVRGNIWMLPLR